MRTIIHQIANSNNSNKLLLKKGLQIGIQKKRSQNKV